MITKLTLEYDGTDFAGWARQPDERSVQGELERVIFEILEIAENELRSVSVSDLRRGIAASIACRAAIKINTPLDQRKMEWMLRTLAATDYPMACPHGRPVALQYSTRDILKSFHRI